MRKTLNKWKTDKCGRCGKPHTNYTGKLDKNNIEYVVCENTNKRMNVSSKGIEGYSMYYSTLWVKEISDEKIN